MLETGKRGKNRRERTREEHGLEVKVETSGCFSFLEFDPRELLGIFMSAQVRGLWPGLCWQLGTGRGSEENRIPWGRISEAVHGRNCSDFWILSVKVAVMWGLEVLLVWKAGLNELEI